MERLKKWARKLKKQLFVLYFAYKDKRVSWYAKVFAAIVVAYAFSPIDLIPDFIPILGYLDDLILVPLGILLTLKMIPAEVIKDCEVKANDRMKNGNPKNWIVGSLIIILWIFFVLWLVLNAYKFIS